MSHDIDTRISRLLDQLENPNLNRAGREEIQARIEFLQQQNRE
jgi:hypothetical protein